MADIKLYVMDNGSMIGPRHFIVSTFGPDGKPDMAPTIETPFYTCLVDHPDGKILFDCACHMDEARQNPFILQGMKATGKCSEENTPMATLAKLGVKPEDIKYVVASHLHADHSGYIDKFPNAEIVVAEQEFTNSVKEYALGISRSEPDIKYWIDCKLKWKLIPAEPKVSELLPGVDIINFGPGHNHGMLGMEVHLKKDGNIIICGDCIYNSENIGPNGVDPGMILDPDGYHKTIEYILKKAKEDNAQFWMGHDQKQHDEICAKGVYE